MEASRVVVLATLLAEASPARLPRPALPVRRRPGHATVRQERLRSASPLASVSRTHAAQPCNTHAALRARGHGHARARVADRLLAVRHEPNRPRKPNATCAVNTAGTKAAGSLYKWWESSPAACAAVRPQRERTSQVSIIDLAKRSFSFHGAGRIRCVSPIPQPPKALHFPEQQPKCIAETCGSYRDREKLGHEVVAAGLRQALRQA